MLLTITLSCLWGFGFVKQGFFPTTNSPLVFVDLRLPQGMDVRATAAEVERLEPLIAADPDVVAITSFIGSGAARFASMIRPEQPNTAYAQLVIRVGDVNILDSAMSRIAQLLQERSVDAEITVRRTEFTPSGTSKIEARFSGPDAKVLRSLASQALDIYLAHDLIDRKTDWRAREIALIPRFDEARRDKPALPAPMSRRPWRSPAPASRSGYSATRTNCCPSSRGHRPQNASTCAACATGRCGV